MLTQVVVRAWPTDEKLADYEVGDMIPVTTMASTSADRTGAYQLRIDPKAEFESLASDDGLLDIEVTADSAGVPGASPGQLVARNP